MQIDKGGIINSIILLQDGWQSKKYFLATIARRALSGFFKGYQMQDKYILYQNRQNATIKATILTKTLVKKFVQIIFNILQEKTHILIHQDFFTEFCLKPPYFQLNSILYQHIALNICGTVCYTNTTFICHPM